jgi:hypothetical protein
VPLYRGAATAFELTVIATPNGCTTHPVVDLDWSEEENVVNVHLHGKGVLQQFPSVSRTEGVDFFPNPFWPETKDFVGGRYQLWIISPAAPITFYYSGTDRHLLGSQYDFAEQPAGSIPVPFPTVRAFPSAYFQPNEAGDVDFTWSFPYGSPFDGARPEFSHYFATFPPPNLCFANPFRYDLTTTRPYITKPRPASEARSFSDYLRSGLLFDLTVEPPVPAAEPPLPALTAAYSNVTIVGGAIPQGWELDFVAAFMNVSPPIRPWRGAGRCENTFSPQHNPNVNFCPPPAP